MFKLEYDNRLPCNHSELCECPVIVTGIEKTPLEGFKIRITGNLQERNKKLAAELMQRFAVVDGQVVQSTEDMYKYYLVNRLHNSPNMEPIAAPMQTRSGFLETPTCDIPMAIKDAFKYADMQTLPKYYEGINFDILHSPNEEVDDFHREVRKRSSYWSAFGTIKGRPFRIAALANASGQKHIDAVMGYSRNTKDLSPKAKEVLKHTDEALRRFYNAMGYGPEDLGKERSLLQFKNILTSYLGSSAGLRPQGVKKAKMPTGETFVMTPNGKKIDVLKDDFEKILHYLETGEEFETYWTLTAKVENFFSWDKQYDDLAWEAWLNKMRLFNIPTSTFIKMEELVSKVRMLKERGRLIMIGCKMAHAGGDKIAENLGIDSTNHWDPILVEGDLKNMDQSVHNYFIKLYMEMMLVHEDPNSEDYAAKVRILEYIIPRLLRRLTRLYSDVWVKHHGTVPSGCFNTSHMDSWIMGLYFFLFTVVQLTNAPDADKVDLEELIEKVKLVVYGDDHLYNKGKTRCSHYLSGLNFQAFLKESFEVELKDIYDGIPFLSVTDRGRIVKRGACFLKQYFVLNSNKDEGQPMYLPFREVNEVMIRAAFGRESTTRTIREVILSVIGHAYGTYASNKLAYDMLYHTYMYLVSKYDKAWRDDPQLEAIYVSKSMRKLRAAGITLEEIRRGFPSWYGLQQQNIKKEGYHDIREEDFDELYMEVMEESQHVYSE